LQFIYSNYHEYFYLIYSEPSTGWRGFTEANMKYGNANFFIGSWTPTTSNVHLRLPELILRNRLQTTTATSYGSFVVRTQTTLTAPSVTGMCTGAYAGVYFVSEKWGIINDFSQLSTRFAKWDPTGIASGIGLVFNVRVTYSGFTGYTAILRNGGTETCAGIYKTVNGVNVALTNQVVTNINILPNASNTVNPTLATTSASARTFVRMGISKTGGTISLWFNTPSNIVLTVVDPSPLAPGLVGVAGIAANSAVYDDLVVIDSPKCNDGIWNGQEEGIDCGGYSDTACSPCVTTDTFTHSFATDGLVGWYQETYGTASNTHYPTYLVDSIYWVQNTGLYWPGTSGKNSENWINGWFYLASKYPTAADVEVSMDCYPKDNDWFGLIWRWQDHNNYYHFVVRQEANSDETPFTIQRRRNGINTVLFVQRAQLPDPYTPTVRTVFMARMIGNVIEVYNGARLLGTATDPDPLQSPGLIGFFGGNQDTFQIYSYTYKITRNPSPAPVQPSSLILSNAAISALTIHVNGPLLPLYSMGTMPVWRGLSSYGKDLHNSPFILPRTTQPGTMLFSNGNAAYFSGSQFLLANSWNQIEPALAGMTFVITMAATATVSTGTVGFVMGKGLRERPIPLMAAGWRLQLTTDRIVSTYPAGTLVTEFIIRSAEGSGDRDASIATPLITSSGSSAINVPFTIAIRIKPNSLSNGLHTRRFTIDALINNVTFMDMVDNIYEGICASSVESYFSIGATDILTDGANVAILELQTFSNALTDADFYNTINYQMNQFIPSINTCPAFNVTNGIYLSGTCTNGAPEGSVCNIGCDTSINAVLTAGSTSVTCRNGKWTTTAFPVCEVTCPTLTAVGTGSNGCSSTIFSESWSTLGTVGSGNGVLPYTRYMITPSSSTTFKVLNAGRLTVTPSFGYRYGSTLSVIINNPAWATVTSRMRIRQQLRVPSIIPSIPLIISAYSRYVDANTYYAIDISLTSDPSIGNLTIVRRVKLNVETVLCSADTNLLPMVPGRMYTFETTFDDASTSTAITVSRDTGVFCRITETTTNLIAAGTVGYGVSGVPTAFSGNNGIVFGTILVETVPLVCPIIGCTGVIAGGNCTLPCNPGTFARGDNVRTCLPTGNYSGTALVCDNGAPLLQDYSATIPELAPVGTFIGIAPPSIFATGKKGDGSIVYEIISGNSNNALAIDSCSGQLSVAQPTLLDFELITPNSSNLFSVKIRAYVPGTIPVAESFATVSVTVTNANDPPIITTTSCSIREDAVLNAAICQLAISDADNSINPVATFRYIFEEYPGLFVLSSTGNLNLGLTNILRFKMKSSYRIVIRASDPVDANIYSTSTILINILDAPVAPVIVSNLAYLEIDQSKMVMGYVPNFNMFNAVIDDDVGTVLTLINSYFLTTPSLLIISSNGVVQVASTQNYNGVQPYLKDGRLVVGYGEVQVTLSDNTSPTPLLGIGTYRIYVLANITGVLGPIVKQINVLPKDSGSGSGNVGGSYLLNTDGQDSVKFLGDNFIYVVTHNITATVTTTKATLVRNYTVWCSYVYTGQMSGSQPVADSIICPTRPGYGTDWLWTISIIDTNGNTPVTVVPGIALITSYAPPVITSILPFGPIGTIPDFPTTGNTRVSLVGYNLGGATDPIVISLGRVDSVTNTISWIYTLTNAVGSHTGINARTPPGSGANLRVQITLGEYTTIAPMTVLFSYNIPTITSIVRKTTTVWQYGMVPPVYSGSRAEDIVTVRGTNLGPIGPAGTIYLTFGLPSWPTDQLLYRASCSYTNATATHTEVDCILPEANGGEHTAFITNNGQNSLRTTAGGISSIIYHSSYVNSISGPGARAADTRGGSIIYFNGINFGPKIMYDLNLCSPIKAWYGAPNNASYTNLEYNMTDCEVNEAGTQIQCKMVEGTGYTPPHWQWTVVSCGTGYTGTSSDIRYAPPIITSFELDPLQSPGSVNADTRGGQNVIIRGLNFGPSMRYVTASYSAMVTGSDNVIREVRYNATNCVKPVNDERKLAHEMMNCTTVPGAGAGMKWEIIVETQASVALTTSYALPTITDISTVPPPSTLIPATTIDDFGGTIVYIIGTQFGLKSMPILTTNTTGAVSTITRSLVQWVRFGINGGQDIDSYTPLAFDHIIDHSVIKVILPPGIGKNLHFQVSVADEVSSISSSSISYTIPQIISLSSSTGPTRGGIIIKAYIINAGLLDITTDHILLISGVAVPIIERYPTRDRVLAVGGNASLLSMDEQDRSNHYVTFRIPEGAGTGVTVQIKAYRNVRPSNQVISNIANDVSANPSIIFNYATPIITSVSAELVDSTSVLNLTNIYLPSLTPSELNTYRYVTISGTNFGSSTLSGILEVATVDLSGNITSSWSSTSYTAALVSWDHEQITVFLKLSRASVRIYVPPVSSTYGTASTSQPAIYLDVSSTILSLVGGITDLNTQGGDIRTIQVASLTTFTNIMILVGNNEAQVVDSLDNVVPNNLVKSVIVDPQTLVQIGQGISLENIIIDLRVRIPPGQGKGVRIVIFRDNVPSTPFYVDYASPFIYSLTLANYTEGILSSTILSTTVNAANPFRIPTKGTIVTVRGINFGTCPIIKIDPTTIQGALCHNDTKVTDTITVLRSNHTEVTFILPEGTGNYGYGLTIYPGDRNGDTNNLDSRSNFIPFAYDLPNITSIESSWPQYGFPTSGNINGTNIQLLINGTNFGAYTSPLPIVRIRLNNNVNVLCSNLQRLSTFVSHTSLICTLPPGAGVDLNIEISVDGQTMLIPSIFSYNRPIIASIMNMNVSSLNYGKAQGDTIGKYIVQITGENFGTINQSCIFLPASNIPVTSLICNNMADNWDEEEIENSRILEWSHTSIKVLMPEGMGQRTVRIVANGQLSKSATYQSDSFTYNAPIITSITPLTSSTDGGIEVTLQGTNFGYGSTSRSAARLRNKKLSPIIFPAALPLPTTKGYPQPFALRINFFTATRCITAAVSDYNATKLLLSVEDCYSEFSQSSFNTTVLAHSHSQITFTTLPGVGKNRNLTISIIGSDGIEVTSNVIAFSYAPPELKRVTPNIIRLPEPTIIVSPTSTNRGVYSFNPTRLVFGGNNFGPIGMESTWTIEERKVEITISNYKCNDAARKTINQESILECNYALDTVISGGVLLSNNAVPRVGYVSVSATVAGQLSVPTASNFLHVVCDIDTYGLPGEICLSCPYGATCDGFKPVSTINDVAKATFRNYINNDGLNVTECMSCHTAPSAKPGFFNMKGYVNDNGESETVCDPIRKEEGLRSNKECENFVACDPPEACLGANICADGYANKAFPYRCSQCADGYYRSSGSCRQCPNNPELNIVFFFIVAVVAIGIGWFLNRKQVNIAFLTIGLDYIQVISIFASTRVAWPQQIKDLFRILSAFNLNIEIIAPECAFKGITYKQKWGMIMALPIAVFALLLVIHFSTIVYAVLIKGQSSRNLVRTTASPLIAMGQVLMYFLYLYITRSVFDVMTCRSPDPAEYDSKGNAILYMAGVYERCGVSGGTQLTLLGPAIAALVIYVLGYPIAIGYNLYKHQDLVMEDQLLRAKRVGDDRLTNPNALEFRRRFSRAYYQFKPECFLWVLVILLRKFLIAISSLIFNTNQNFQMAAMLLVLFLAYAMQVRFFPYMGPKNFDEVLKQHEEAVRQCNPLHLRLAATLSGIQARGKRQSRTQSIQNKRALSVSAIAGTISSFLFDYNVVESILLASALLVSLAGIMFGATVGSQGSSFYQQSRDGVMGAIIAVIALSIIYWLTVVAVEIITLSMEQRNRERIELKLGARSNSKNSPASKNLSKVIIGNNNNSSNGLSNEGNSINMGVIESENNPLFFVKNTDTNNDSNDDSMLNNTNTNNISSMDIDAIRNLTNVSSPTVWNFIQSGFLDLADQVTALENEKQRLTNNLLPLPKNNRPTSTRNDTENIPTKKGMEKLK